MAAPFTPDSGVSEVRRQPFYFIAPDALAMPQYILDMLDEKGIAWSLHSSIEEVMAEVDILYMTRVQKSVWTRPSTPT